MAITKAVVAIFAALVVDPGGTKVLPALGGSGSHVATGTAGSGSTVGMRIRNGASAPGAAGTMTLQQSPDGGTTWFDVFTFSGSTIASDDVTVTITLPRGTKGLRALCYGNTTNAVTFEAIATVVTD